jgi:hypothetical protein
MQNESDALVFCQILQEITRATTEMALCFEQMANDGSHLIVAEDIYRDGTDQTFKGFSL